jgi:hypothetical protein
VIGDRKRRSQLLGRGERAVLLARRRAEEFEAVSTAWALDYFARAAFELVAILDPDDYATAHQMVFEGVVARAEHLPSVRMVWLPSIVSRC